MRILRRAEKPENVDDYEGQGHLEGAQGHSGGLGRIRTLGRDKEGQGGTRMLRKGMNYQKGQGQLEGMGIVSKNGNGQGVNNPRKRQGHRVDNSAWAGEG